LGDLVTALLDAGLKLTALCEYTYCKGFNPYPDMSEPPERRMTSKPVMPPIPLIFAVSAQK